MQAALLASVPLWIDQITQEAWSESYREERRKICSQEIAERGDLLFFRGKKSGGSAQAFNRLAEGLALLSFAPGGVRFLGLHFEA